MGQYSILLSQRVFTTHGIIERLRRVKARLSRQGPLLQALIPAVEVCEFLLSHGLREVVARSRVRLGAGGAERRVSVRPEPLPNRTSGPWDPLVLPAPHGPVTVSFVLHATGGAFLTYHAIRSVTVHAAPTACEMLVVGDVDRETDAMIARVSGAISRYAGSDATALNRAIAAASGTYLCFLDSVTGLMAQGVSASLTLLEATPDVGAVAPKIVTEDGRVYSAGHIVWSDGLVDAYGQGADSGTPEVNYVREVDASVLPGLVVRRSVLLRLDGLAVEFVPSTYGMADLCFRLREQQQRVMYQPAALVVHRSTGSLASSRGEASAAQDAERCVFRTRHAPALLRQCSGGDRQVRAARDRRSGMSILVVDRTVPKPDRDSGSVRITAILRMLSEFGHRTTFLPDNQLGEEPYTARLQQMGIEVIYGAGGDEYLSRHGRDFDVVILCRVQIAETHIAPLLRIDVEHRPSIVFDTVDLHFVREQRQAALGGDTALAATAEQTKTLELALMRSSSRIWVTSVFEADLLRPELNLPPIDLVPNIHEVPSAVPPFEGREHILFIGGFLHPPNEDAVLYFVTEIFPQVRAAIPSAEFLVVGSDMPRSIRTLDEPGVRVLGYVEDVAPLFDRCRVSVAPLRYGAGVKGKVTQSLTLGLPAVATSIAAEGLALVPGEHVAVADAPDEFARRVIEVYTNETLWTRLSTSGREHLSARLGYAAVKTSLGTILDQVGRQAGV